jgi:hypothetical protein
MTFTAQIFMCNLQNGSNKMYSFRPAQKKMLLNKDKMQTALLHIAEGLFDNNY